MTLELHGAETKELRALQSIARPQVGTSTAISNAQATIRCLTTCIAELLLRVTYGDNHYSMLSHALNTQECLSSVLNSPAHLGPVYPTHRIPKRRKSSRERPGMIGTQYCYQRP